MSRHRRIRLGMVGGGQGAFIGAVHRIAARMDDRFELVAGALASAPERAHASAAELGIDPERSYASFAAMAEAEAKRDDGIEAVSIVTPNHVHVPAALAFLEAGIHVICDKPLAAGLAEAERLAEAAARSDRLFAVTYNYSGYPMVREARARIAAGELGAVRNVMVEYPQGWLTQRLEASGQKQAEWRTDPARSGAGGCVGDIGSHAHHLAGFVTGLELESLCADLSTFVEGRALDDDARVLLRYRGGARGILWASQIAPGCENGLALRIHGEKGGLAWRQEEPNQLWFTPFGETKRLLTRGGDGIGPAAARVSRTPFGHPEGYLEAFANIYGEIGRAIEARRDGRPLDPEVTFPGIADGLDGMRFIDAAVRSSREGAAWITL